MIKGYVNAMMDDGKGEKEAHRGGPTKRSQEESHISLPIPLRARRSAMVSPSIRGASTLEDEFLSNVNNCTAYAEDCIDGSQASIMMTSVMHTHTISLRMINRWHT